MSELKQPWVGHAGLWSIELGPSLCLCNLQAIRRVPSLLLCTFNLSLGFVSLQSCPHGRPTLRHLVDLSKVDFKS